MSSTQGSQINVTLTVKEFASAIQGDGITFLQNAIKKMNEEIIEKPYLPEDVEREAAIRWRRTADEIITDRYTYNGKSCTDRVHVLLALCNAKGYETRFVKLKKEGGTHTVAEVKLPDEWYIVEIYGGWGNGGILKGAMRPDEDINGWKVWRKGRDAKEIALLENMEIV